MPELSRRLPRPLPSLLLALLLVAAPAAAAPAWYVVRSGDFLSRIAQRFGVTVAELKRDNGLQSDVIHPGQRLRLQQPMRRLRAADLHWRRPFEAAPGRVLRDFGVQVKEHGVQVPHTGVDVELPLGSAVLAPAAGVVRYCGEQEGFGVVVIIEHGGAFSTVLAPLAPDSASCRAGVAVLPGDRLGSTAAPVEGDLPYLHLELRQNNKAVPPGRLLR